MLVKDYLLNYARSLIYTTSLTFANIIAVNCSFDLLGDDAAETVGHLHHPYHASMANAVRSQLHALTRPSTYFVDLLRTELKKYPSSPLSLPEHLTPVFGQASHPNHDNQGSIHPGRMTNAIIDCGNTRHPQRALAHCGTKHTPCIVSLLPNTDNTDPHAITLCALLFFPLLYRARVHCYLYRGFRWFHTVARRDTFNGSCTAHQTRLPPHHSQRHHLRLNLPSQQPHAKT